MSEILARKDGRKVREIPSPISAAIPRNETAKTTPATEEPAEKEGFNTIIKCRWCGNKAKEVYIPQLKDGKDGKPHEIIYNYTPCDECKKKWADMVIVIEVTTKELYPKCLPIDEITKKNEDGSEERIKIYPTGRHVGITEELARKALHDSARNGTVIYLAEEEFKEGFDEQFKDA